MRCNATKLRMKMERKTMDEYARLLLPQCLLQGPKVRRRHQFKVRACPQRTKDKLLSMPKAEEDDSPEEFQHE
ncbi:GL21105 [Drosophila persimilis]|uniref:GL21105 n=1 Tax=Drosophila persimilis TaxID=7234 RepID=B4GWW7_DROPE|nr:GL21105 [Drosophila persimilis]